MSVPPFPYSRRALGHSPDCRLSIRNEPVQRDEIRTGRRALLTMPLGTYRFEEREKSWGVDHCLVGVPGLWQPVLDELALEYAADHERAVREWAEMSPGEKAWLSPFYCGPGDSPRPLPGLEFYIGTGGALEFRCEQCGRRFLGRNLARNEVRLCSDKCERLWRLAPHRRWRERHPPDYQALNAKRTQQRAGARAGRTCAHCGAVIEAARSTRRFCSDVCRVRHHHQQRRLARVR